MCKCNGKPTLIRLPNGTVFNSTIAITPICSSRITTTAASTKSFGFAIKIIHYVDRQEYCYKTLAEAEAAYNEFISKFEII